MKHRSTLVHSTMFLRKFLVLLALTISTKCAVISVPLAFGSKVFESFVKDFLFKLRPQDDCSLSTELKKEIESYRPVAQKIINTALEGNFTGLTHKELVHFINKFGNRISGSQNLENAIDYMLDKSEEYGFDNVHGEEVTVPKWLRGSESAILVKPHKQKLHILGLGTSVGTPPQGILAKVLVVKSFYELKKKAHLAKGKIVVYNQRFVNYRTTVEYREKGATEAAKVGAVAALVRAITPFSLNTPHTGMQKYGDNVTKIPVASITKEEALMLQRLQDDGQSIKLFLKMQAHNFPDTKSRNVVFEIKGDEHPEKIIIASGHIDSWDVGEGVVDSGGGIFVTWEALALLKSLGLNPKRTIRGILWTGEEFGLVGARAYAKQHKNESDNFLFFMESNLGTFNPVGLQYMAGPTGQCILRKIIRLFYSIDATNLRKSSKVGSDISVWTKNGYPGAALDTESGSYFWYHHTSADTMEVADAFSLDKSTALCASLVYILSNLSIDFPRESLVSAHSSK